MASCSVAGGCTVSLKSTALGNDNVFLCQHVEGEENILHLKKTNTANSNLMPRSWQLGFLIQKKTKIKSEVYAEREFRDEIRSGSQEKKCKWNSANQDYESKGTFVATNERNGNWICVKKTSQRCAGGGLMWRKLGWLWLPLTKEEIECSGKTNWNTNEKGFSTRRKENFNKLSPTLQISNIYYTYTVCTRHSVYCFYSCVFSTHDTLT